MTWQILQEPDVALILSILPHARLVGGAVRDALLALPVADIDLATPETPEATVRRLEEAGLRAVPTGLAHGTVTAIVGHRPFEVTTLRRDVATDGRHANVAWTDDWREDAARRDFTINAMSLDRGGILHDDFCGARDLARGRVRFVGDAAQRIAEDYLRVLRFFRFQARYGRGEPDADAVGAIAAAVPGLAILSAERVWGELKRILSAPDPAPAMRLMASLGVLAAIVPEGADPERLAVLVARRAPADPLLRMAALLAGDPVHFARRLKLSVAEQARLIALRAGPAPATADEEPLRRLLADEDADILAGRVWLSDVPTDQAAGVHAALAGLSKPVFPLEGRDALALGAQPGPAVGAALRRVRDRWLAEGCRTDKDQLLTLLREALAAG